MSSYGRLEYSTDGRSASSIFWALQIFHPLRKSVVVLKSVDVRSVSGGFVSACA